MINSMFYIAIIYVQVANRIGVSIQVTTSHSRKDAQRLISTRHLKTLTYISSRNTILHSFNIFR